MTAASWPQRAPSTFPQVRISLRRRSPASGNCCDGASAGMCWWSEDYSAFHTLIHPHTEASASRSPAIGSSIRASRARLDGKRQTDQRSSALRPSDRLQAQITLELFPLATLEQSIRGIFSILNNKTTIFRFIWKVKSHRRPTLTSSFLLSCLLSFTVFMSVYLCFFFTYKMLYCIFLHAFNLFNN